MSIQTSAIKNCHSYLIVIFNVLEHKYVRSCNLWSMILKHFYQYLIIFFFLFYVMFYYFYIQPPSLFTYVYKFHWFDNEALCLYFFSRESINKFLLSVQEKPKDKNRTYLFWDHLKRNCLMSSSCIHHYYQYLKYIFA